MNKVLLAAVLALLPACRIIDAIHTAQQKPDDIIAKKTQTELAKLSAGGDADINLDGTPDVTVTVNGDTVTQVWHGAAKDRITATLTSTTFDMVGDLNEDGKADYTYHNEGDTEVETRDRNFDGTEDWRRTSVSSGVTEISAGTVTDTIEELRGGTFVTTSTRTHSENLDACPVDMTTPPPPGAPDTCDGLDGLVGDSSGARSPVGFPKIHVHDGGGAGACDAKSASVIATVIEEAIPRTITYLTQWNLPLAVIFARGVAERPLHISCGNQCTYGTTGTIKPARRGVTIAMNISIAQLLAKGAGSPATSLDDPGVQGSIMEVVSHELLHYVGVDHDARESIGADVPYACGRQIANCMSHLPTAKDRDSARDCAVCASDDQRVKCGTTQTLVDGEDADCSGHDQANVPTQTFDVCLVDPNTSTSVPCTCCKLNAWTYCDKTRVTDADRAIYQLDEPQCCRACDQGTNEVACGSASTDMVTRACNHFETCLY